MRTTRTMVTEASRIVSAFLTLSAAFRDARNVVARGKPPNFAVGWTLHLVMTAYNTERGFAF